MEGPSKTKMIGGFSLDLAANFAGVGWSALVQIVCVPIYIKFLGIEAFGLIGFYLVLQSLLQVLDFGLSPTINREMARYSVLPEKAAEARDLVRTLEAGYWIVGIAIGAAILAAAPSIATHWIRAGTFPVQTVRQAVMIMGILAFFQWPLSFYQGGLLGLGRQVLLNVVRISLSTVGNGGTVLILWLLSPTIRAFFLWQAAVSAAQVAVVAIFLWKSLPRANRVPRIDFKLLKNVRRFAAGMSGITAFALVLTQTDKVILSRLLDLKVFGYYALAGMFGTGLSMIIGTVFNTIYPRFSALVAVGDNEALKNLYHRGTQLMAVLILPLAAVFALFSTDILLLWTRNPEVAHHAGPIATLLVIGTALIGLMNLPYALQLAHGWTSLGLGITISLTILVVPAIWFMATSYGAVGAASVWAGQNVIYMAIGIPLTHRRLLRHEMARWFIEDVAPVSGAVFLVAGLARAFFSSAMPLPLAPVTLSVVFLGALLAAALAAPQIRGFVFTNLSRLWLSYA